MQNKGIKPIEDIARKIKGEIDQFKPKVPLLVALRNKGMCDRHWKAIQEKIGCDPIKYQDPEFNF